MKVSLPVAALGLLCLAACAPEEHDDLKQWMQEESKDLKSNVKAPPPLIPPPIVSYAAKDLESPFSGSKIRVRDNASITDKDKLNPGAGRPPEYLEGFPLESMRLIGIINYDGKMFGLVQTPEKPKHVTVGNYIGTNFGKITAITQNEMRISEMVRDANDLWVKKEKVMYLQQDGGGRR